MKWLQSPLLRALRAPESMEQFSVQDWDLAVRQARSAGLLARLGLSARERGARVHLPAGAEKHFTALDCIVARQHNAVRWEVHQIARALASTNAPVVLLKGAAYAASDAPAAAGRTFNDIDILVPKERLSDVEHALYVHGWLVESDSAYDERYYRRWMHELPPMVHLHRRTTLDVHHNLLPETARIQTRPDLLIADAVPLPQWRNVYVPSPVDQILHSACHLFHEGEWGHGLRDLFDLHLLLTAFGRRGGSGADLVHRAELLNLTMPLSYAIRCAVAVFATPLPEGTQALLAGRMGKRWMDGVFLRALSTAHPTLRATGAGWAESALYVRSHWLRMPLQLLLPHLAHQAFSNKQKAADKE